MDATAHQPGSRGEDGVADAARQVVGGDGVKKRTNAVGHQLTYATPSPVAAVGNPADAAQAAHWRTCSPNAQGTAAWWTSSPSAAQREAMRWAISEGSLASSVAHPVPAHEASKDGATWRRSPFDLAQQKFVQPASGESAGQRDLKCPRSTAWRPMWTVPGAVSYGSSSSSSLGQRQTGHAAPLGSVNERGDWEKPVNVNGMRHAKPFSSLSFAPLQPITERRVAPVPSPPPGARASDAVDGDDDENTLKLAWCGHIPPEGRTIGTRGMKLARSPSSPSSAPPQPTIERRAVTVTLPVGGAVDNDDDESTLNLARSMSMAWSVHDLAVNTSEAKGARSTVVAAEEPDLLRYASRAAQWDPLEPPPGSSGSSSVASEDRENMALAVSLSLSFQEARREGSSVASEDRDNLLLARAMSLSFKGGDVGDAPLATARMDASPQSSPPGRASALSSMVRNDAVDDTEDTDALKPCNEPPASETAGKWAMHLELESSSTRALSTKVSQAPAIPTFKASSKRGGAVGLDEDRVMPEERRSPEKSANAMPSAREKILSVFRNFDTSGSDAISCDDFIAVLKKLQPSYWNDSKRVDILLSAVDVDEGGMMPFESILSWLFAAGDTVAA